MSGICGIVGIPPHSLFTSIQAALSHRGQPDIWTDVTTGLISFDAKVAVSEDLIVVADAPIDNAPELKEHFTHNRHSPQVSDAQLIASTQGSDCPQLHTPILRDVWAK